MDRDYEDISDSTDQVTLTAERVVATALFIVQRHGVEALSMRRVAGLLAVQPTSLYRCVETRQSLLDLVVDSSVQQLSIPCTGSPTQRLQRLLSDLYELTVDNPALQAALPGSLLKGRGLLSTRVNPTIAELLEGTRWGTAQRCHVHQSLLGLIAALAGTAPSACARDALPSILAVLLDGTGAVPN